MQLYFTTKTTKDTKKFFSMNFINLRALLFLRGE